MESWQPNKPAMVSGNQPLFFHSAHNTDHEKSNPPKPFACSCAPPPCSTSASLARTLAPTWRSLRPLPYLGVNQETPYYTVAPRPRSLRPSSLHPAGNGDSTMQSLHSAITAPCNHLLRSTRQLPNSPTSQQVGKPISRKVGKLASAPPPGSPPARLIVHTSSHPRPRRPYPGVSKHRPPALAPAPPPTKDGARVSW